MNPDVKLVAAAQRAARRIARAESVSYQSSLDTVARQAGRSTWSAFLADPVPVDEAAETAASEPDFTRTSIDGHLHAAIDHGIAIGARAFLARPAKGPSPERLIYCSARGMGYDHPIDARGMSTGAMVVAIAALPRTSQDGLVEIQDAKLAYEIDDIGDGSMQLRVSLDAALPPEAPIDDPDDGMIRDDRRSRLAAEEAAVANAAPIAASADAHDIMERLLELAWSVPGADVVLEPRGEGYDAMLVAGRRRRIVHVGDISEYATMRATAKDRGRMDQMEFRVPQYGEYSQEIDGDHRTVHVMTLPVGRDGREQVRLGFRPFVRLSMARPSDIETVQGGAIQIGEHGMITRTMHHTGIDQLVVVSGRRGSGRTSRFVVPAILAAHGVDVVVSDMRGDLVARLGEAWTEHASTIRLDPRVKSTSRRAPAFNPFHPDMMPTGHISAATWVARILVTGEDETSRHARDMIVGAVDLLINAVEHRPAGPDPEAVLTLPLVGEWLSTRIEEAIILADDLSESRAIHARRCFETFSALGSDMRLSVVDRLHDALNFLGDPDVAKLLSPTDEDRGAAIAQALVLRRQPTLIVVSGDPEAGQGRLAALVMQAVAHLRHDQAIRQTHLHVDDAETVGPMPWLSHALLDGMPRGFSGSVILDKPKSIDVLEPALAGGRLPKVRHWLVEEIRSPEDRRRVAAAMGIRHSKVSTHDPDGRHLDVTPDGVKMLRR